MSETPFVASLETDVPVTRTIASLQKLVERFKAKEFRLIYGDESRPAAIRFSISDPHLGLGGGLFTVELAAPCVMIAAHLQREHRTWAPEKCAAQADRVAWRQLHDYVRSALIAVQWGVLTVGEAFLAGLVVTAPNGEEARLGQLVTEHKLLRPENGRLMLGKGS